MEVSDRFGDYGLVGVMIFGARGEALEVDTFLLSCRVLGRGVEHRMLQRARRDRPAPALSLVAATLIPTKKNQPAATSSTGGRVLPPGGRRGLAVRDPGRAWPRPSPTARGRPSRAVAETSRGRSRRAAGPTGDAAGDRHEVGAVRADRHRAVPARTGPRGDPHPRRAHRRAALSSAGRSIAPRTEIEAELAAIWAELLRLEPVGFEDNYFDLGGTSLLAVDLFARIEHRFGKKLPLTSLIEAPTIEQLARLVAGAADRDSLVLIRDGGDRPPLFLVHDGDGETMLYRNLALRLKPTMPSTASSPIRRPDVPMAHTRIAEMAAYHIDKIRSVQPRGPYLVGGMCAGGVIAFEIARQLQGQGEKVAMVALIDAADVEAPLKALRIASQRLQLFAAYLATIEPDLADPILWSLPRRSGRPGTRPPTRSCSRLNACGTRSE